MSKYLKAITQARNTKLCSILPKDRKARFEIWVLRSSEFCESTVPLTDWATNGSPLDGILSGKSWWSNVSPYSMAPFTSLSMPYCILWCTWPQTWVWTSHLVYSSSIHICKQLTLVCMLGLGRAPCCHDLPSGGWTSDIASTGSGHLGEYSGCKLPGV